MKKKPKPHKGEKIEIIPDVNFVFQGDKFPKSTKELKNYFPDRNFSEKELTALMKDLKQFQQQTKKNPLLLIDLQKNPQKTFDELLPKSSPLRDAALATKPDLARVTIVPPEPSPTERRNSILRRTLAYVVESQTHSDEFSQDPIGVVARVNNGQSQADIDSACVAIRVVMGIPTVFQVPSDRQIGSERLVPANNPLRRYF